MKKIVILLLITLSIFSCKKEFEDKNKITEAAAYSTPEAYPGIVLGMTKKFTTGALYSLVKGPGLTSKEFGSTNTYVTPNQFAEGGPGVAGDNVTVTGLWSSLHRSRGMAEKVLQNIDDAGFVDQDKHDAFKAYAMFFNALTTGYMAEYWEQVTVQNDPNNSAEFMSREAGLQQALDNMDGALAILSANSNAEGIINNLVSFEFSFVDVIHAFKARYQMELGHYQEAFDEADAVDLTKRSVWSYDGGSIKNPIFSNLVDPAATLSYKPYEDLGLTGTQAPELGDLRVDFYLQDFSGDDINCNNPVDNPEGFWTTDASPIPVYLPGEMLLIKAEAKARLGAGTLADAVTYLNQVRTKTPVSDVFGVGASLAAWTGNASSQQDVLDEIYKNYAIELYMQGQRWVIHRRFYPSYLDNVDWHNVDACSLERVNNFYPYPESERSNNANCPADPAY